MMIRRLLILPLLVVGLVFSSCDGDGPEEPKDTFDKEAMLTNMASGVIIPAYEDLQESLTNLQDVKDVWSAQPSASTFDALRDQYAVVHTKWVACSAYEFGPAAENNLRLTFNTFPTDTAQINQNVASGNYDLEANQNSDAIGLPALDYLLYFYEADDAVVQLAEYEGYVQANIDLMTKTLDAVVDAWNASYTDDFTSSTGSAAGSSTSLLVNELNFDYELVKNASLGIPAGKKTLGITQPYKVESPYGRHSKSLAIAHVQALRNCFAGGSGQGLDDYLDNIEAKHNGELLSQAILDGFDDVETKLAAISGDLLIAVDDEATAVEAAYVSMQNLVVLLKTDMPSQLGIQITYQDNDGD